MNEIKVITTWKTNLDTSSIKSYEDFIEFGELNGEEALDELVNSVDVELLINGESVGELNNEQKMEIIDQLI